jgi:methionyl-tRNA formyltransferase
MRIVFFTELNSKMGAGVFDVLRASSSVTELLLVTRADDVLCSYFLFDPDAPNLKAIARGAGIPILQSEAINTPEFRARIEEFAPDYLVVANYQKKIGKKLAAIPRVAALNFHPAPLPRYAGLASFFWMAKAGETRAGTTCHLVTDVIDAGDVVGRAPIALTGRETTGQIRDLHFAASAALMAELLPRLANESLAPVPQDLRDRTYFGRPSPADTTIDWRAGMEPVLRTVRACLPHPGALARLPNGVYVHVTSADAYRAERVGVRPGTLEKSGGDWIAATVDGWIRINSIACFGGEAPPDPDEVAAGELVLSSDAAEFLRSDVVGAEDVLAQLMLVRAPVALAR